MITQFINFYNENLAMNYLIFRHIKFRNQLFNLVLLGSFIVVVVFSYKITFLFWVMMAMANFATFLILNSGIKKVLENEYGLKWAKGIWYSYGAREYLHLLCKSKFKEWILNEYINFDVKQFNELSLYLQEEGDNVRRKLFNIPTSFMPVAIVVATSYLNWVFSPEIAKDVDESLKILGIVIGLVIVFYSLMLPIRSITGEIENRILNRKSNVLIAMSRLCKEIYLENEFNIHDNFDGNEKKSKGNMASSELEIPLIRKPKSCICKSQIVRNKKQNRKNMR